jgi:hypothetical protein
VARLVDGWNSAPSRQQSELFASIEEERIGLLDQRTDVQASKGSESGVNLAFGRAIADEVIE